MPERALGRWRRDLRGTRRQQVPSVDKVRTWRTSWAHPTGAKPRTRQKSDEWPPAGTSGSKPRRNGSHVETGTACGGGRPDRLACLRLDDFDRPLGIRTEGDPVREGARHDQAEPRRLSYPVRSPAGDRQPARLGRRWGTDCDTSCSKRELEPAKTADSPRQPVSWDAVARSLS